MNRYITDTDLAGCENCHRAMPGKNAHSRYCSDECRMEAIRNRKKSDFYTSVDEFDSAGYMEWINPENS